MFVAIVVFLQAFSFSAADSGDFAHHGHFILADEVEVVAPVTSRLLAATFCLIGC